MMLPERVEYELDAISLPSSSQQRGRALEIPLTAHGRQKENPPKARHCHDDSHSSAWNHAEIEVAYLGNSTQLSTFRWVFVRSAPRFAEDFDFWPKRLFQLDEVDLSRKDPQRSKATVTLSKFIPHDEA